MELEGSADGNSQADWPQGFLVRLHLQIGGPRRGCNGDGKELVTAGYGMLWHREVSFCSGNLQASSRYTGR